MYSHQPSISLSEQAVLDVIHIKNIYATFTSNIESRLQHVYSKERNALSVLISNNVVTPDLEIIDMCAYFAVLKNIAEDVIECYTKMRLDMMDYKIKLMMFVQNEYTPILLQHIDYVVKRFDEKIESKINKFIAEVSRLSNNKVAVVFSREKGRFVVQDNVTCAFNQQKYSTIQPNNIVGSYTVQYYPANTSQSLAYFDDKKYVLSNIIEIDATFPCEIPHIISSNSSESFNFLVTPTISTFTQISHSKGERNKKPIDVYTQKLFVPVETSIKLSSASDTDNIFDNYDDTDQYFS